MTGKLPMKKSIFLFVLLTLFAGATSHAQFQFGQNKVQYKYYKWNYIQSDHFDLYFTDGNYKLAEFAILSAESAYVKISKDFKYSINNRITFIIYGSHNEFQQTNAIGGYLDEGIGGVTELFKNRIVLPFEGNFQQFRHVIHHELVHAVINDMFYAGSIQNMISQANPVEIPLWFNEGVAEFSALDWDSNTDLFMRDAVINTYLAPIEQLNGYFAYRGGQSLWYYITQKYGREKIAEIMQRLRSVRRVNEAFVGALGLTLEELSERWQKDLKVRYWPEIATRDDIKSIGRRLTDHKKDGSNYNTSPSISPKGDKIALITDKNRYIDIELINAIDGKVIKKLVDGQRSRNFEELHLITPGISWSPDGKRIAVSTKAAEEDVIMLLDVKTGDEEKLAFGLDGIFSVDWSRDGEKLAFQGLKNGNSDIYVYEFKTKQLINITNDAFSDMDPSWSPDSKRILFVSDRNSMNPGDVKSGGRELFSKDLHQTDIFELTLETRSIERITETDGFDESNPIYGPDGKNFLFISDENGAYNIFSMNLEKKTVRPLTNVLQGIRQMSVTYDGGKLALVALDDAGFDIFTINNPFELKVKGDTLTSNLWANFRESQAEKIKNKLISANRFSPDSEIGKNTVSDTLRHYVFDPEASQEIRSNRADTINFSNYEFSESVAKEEEENSENVPAIKYSSEGTRLPGGEFKVFDYKLNFSVDYAQTNLGVNNIYGASGSTQMVFSDMLGNHQIIFASNLVVNLENSDFFLAYYYLPKRYDVGVFGYHTAKYFPFSTYHPEIDTTTYDYYRFRNYGIGLSLSYPFDKYNRLELDLGFSILSKENIDWKSPIEEIAFVNPKLEYTHDTVLWGPLAPNNGSRYGIAFQAVPSFLSNRLEFYTVSADYRTYWRLTDYTSFAVRGAGAISGGKTPQKYFIGGVEQWLNVRLTNRDHFPIKNVEDFVFAEAGLPLRGFDLNEQFGNRYFILNGEFRFPMLLWLFPEVNSGSFFMGTIFTDLGSAWDQHQKFQAFSNSKGMWGTEDLLWGSGFGVRTFFLYFLLKVDVAWNYDFRYGSKPQYYISLGGDF